MPFTVGDRIMEAVGIAVEEISIDPVGFDRSPGLAGSFGIVLPQAEMSAIDSENVKIRTLSGFIPFFQGDIMITPVTNRFLRPHCVPAVPYRTGARRMDCHNLDLGAFTP